MADFSPLATQEIGGISVRTVGGETVTEYGTGNIVTDTGITTSLGTPATTDNFPPQTDWEQEPDPVVTLPKRYGAHKSVIDKLSQISFVSGCTGGEMSDAIAYIRYWSRSGVSQKNPVQLSQQFTLPDSKSQELSTTLSNLYGSDIDFNSTRYSLPENYRPADAFKGTPVNLFNSQYDFTIPEFNPTVAVSEQPQSGSVYAANPSGSTESSSASPNDAVWQFLFNPEELQLSSGPEYNRAESWGVSDPANSGQPLSWRMNRNRKLTFGKVLLHGYTFGKRVDSLEKGLQDLFMAREGEGSDGPPVLEFVWGKRVFGPCVIQNIQVREKAWDKGILVNAEVSFELEQVPEWTINDGFVDVLRPGRQPTVNDPSIASENYRSTPSSAAPTGEDDQKANKGGGGGGQQTGELNQCRNLKSDYDAWNQLIKSINNKKKGINSYKSFQPPSLLPQLIPGVPIPIWNPSFPGLNSSYKGLFNTFVENQFYNKYSKSVKNDRPCEPDQIYRNYYSVVSIQGSDKKKANSEYNEILLKCVQKIPPIIDKVRGDLDCKSVESFIGPRNPNT